MLTLQDSKDIIANNGGVMRKYYILSILLIALLSLCSCETTSINAEGTLKIKNVDTSEDAVDIKNIKIILLNSEKVILDTDIQISSGIVKVFNLDADQYTVYATANNGEKKFCQCLVKSGKTTYLQWDKKEEMNNSYILYEVDNY